MLAREGITAHLPRTVLCKVPRGRRAPDPAAEATAPCAAKVAQQSDSGTQQGRIFGVAQVQSLHLVDERKGPFRVSRGSRAFDCRLNRQRGDGRGFGSVSVYDEARSWKASPE